MKLRYPIIAAIIMFVAIPILEAVIIDSGLYEALASALLFLIFICLCLIVCLLLRNLFRAIKGQIGKKDR